MAFLAFGVAVASLGGAVLGQEPPADAAVIAAEIAARYGSLPSLRARFEQRYVHRLHAHEEHWRGRITLRRPAKIRIDYERPRGRVVVCDGTTLISFDPDPAPGIWWEQPVSADALPIALAILGGTSAIDAGLDLRVIDARATGFAGSVLELRPQHAIPTIDRVLVYVDRAPARRGRVHRLMIVDPAGNTNRFDLSEPREGGVIPESIFSWRPPAAARRVEP